MEVGIIGKGKMGIDIFNYFIEYDYNLILICRSSEDIESLEQSVQKQLNKMKRRGLISDEMFAKKMSTFKVSNDVSDLKNCDLVIESVYEDKMLKQRLFKKIEDAVKPDCILATNSSSIPLKIVFEKCARKERCMGLHFFYPVKITNVVEINKMSQTQSQYVEAAKEILSDINKNALVLEEEANMILTKMFTILITQIYNIYEEKYLKIEDIDKIIKENLLTFGLFEIIDSTGINIIVECINNFIDDRYRKIYTPFYNKGLILLEKGYQGGKGKKGITAYENENSVTLKQLNDEDLSRYKNDILLLLQSLIVNEIVYIISNNYAEKQAINQAIKEVFGLSEDPISMYKRIGNETIKGCLLDNYNRLKDNVYLPLELSVLDD